MASKSSVAALIAGILFLILHGCAEKNSIPFLDQEKLAKQYFQEDYQWYLDNIPFFECSDRQLEQVYYYRWKMYKAHIRNVGDNSYVITEFINHVLWDREPYCTINAASMHHIYEGRWLKDNCFMDRYISYLYQDGGNDRRYSESIADATYARYLVNCDSAFLVRQLESMKRIYDDWSDHWDPAKNLYYIPAMPDATEYTIASIDASGGKGGFDDGEAFRPTINSYMYGNAMAISRIAALKGDSATSREYLQKANSLKANIEKNLWNPGLQHFTDRFKVDNEFVHYWDFIRGRELAGLIPWYFDLPSDNQIFNSAWKHAVDTTELLGKYGFRTNEPSYEYYFKQFVFYQGQRGSQWNGPSWPYQSSQALTGMANFLNNYNQEVISKSDYVKSLRLFALQHYLPDGKINLVENYDPNLGGPIVYYYWSNHYNHSSFNNLIITGLCGIRPSESDTLTINPLVDNSIGYFRLDDIRYHGHKLTVIYDNEGAKYNLGRGLTVFIDGKKADLIEKQDKYQVLVGKPLAAPADRQPVNLALNITRNGYPVLSASKNAEPDSLFQAFDGRIWYFPEIRNRWTTLGSSSTTDWLAVEFGQSREISMVKIYPFTDDKTFGIPYSITVEYLKDEEWLPVKIIKTNPAELIGNTCNTLFFNRITVSKIRISFNHENKQVAISEVECL
jgi:hypothetical protein